LPDGSWWGFSMMDARAAARMTYLSPVTWKDGWPYFGLSNNLGRSPRTWIKPVNNTLPHPLYKRSDDFNAAKMNPVWEWNHWPVDTKWSLTEKKGKLVLHTLPAPNFLKAKNTLAQHVMGPESSASVWIDANHFKTGDVAGIAFLSIPYYWIGIIRQPGGFAIRLYNQLTDQTIDKPLKSGLVAVKAQGNYDKDAGWLSYSTNGKNYETIGGELRLAYQMKTFQGVKYALFAYNTLGNAGGYAEFDNFELNEPLANRAANIPTGKIIAIQNFANNTTAFIHSLGLLHHAAPGSSNAKSNAARFKIIDEGQGRVSLEAVNGGGFLTVVGEGLSGDVRLFKTKSEGSIFQWQDMLRKQFMLLSLKTHRYVGLNPLTHEPYGADWPGTQPDRKDGTVLVWEEVQ
jgi:xylan 1,4-beta-xylosidase